MMHDTKDGQANYCPMCEVMAKELAELKQRVKVLTDVLQRASTSLGAFCGDEGWGMEDMNTMDFVDAVLASTPKQTAAQIERWHIEWMMKLPVMAYGDRLGTHLQQAYCVPDTGVPPWMMHMTKLVSIPQLPKDSDSTETDLDEWLRRQ